MILPGKALIILVQFRTTPIVIDHNNTDRTITVPVTIVTNDTYDGWGEITATLTNGSDYTVNPNANSKSVEIVDDDTAPHSVSINAPVSVIEGKSISVTLTASPALEVSDTLSVDLHVSDVTGSYLNYNVELKTITSANSSSITFEIPTHNLSERDINGEIKLELKRRNGYELGSISTQNITVLDTALLPEVSISAVNTGPIDEGEMAVFNLSATPNPTTKIKALVEVQDAQGTGNFINSEDITVHEVPISISGKGILPIMTIADIISEDSGSITAIIKAETDRTKLITYAVDENNDTAIVAITDNDTSGLPIVTISGTDSIDEGATATFTLTAASIGSNSISVRVRVSQKGSFLSRDISSTNEFTYVIRADGDIPGQLKIDEATEADAVEEEDGSITLRVLSDPLSTDTYSVGEISSHTTTVVDDDDVNLPSISIASGGDVTEGSDAVFNITATHVGSAPSILVSVQVSEVGNFLSNSVGIESVMVSVGTTTPYRVSTEDDAYDEDNGSITATILKDTDGSVDYGDWGKYLSHCASFR